MTAAEVARRREQDLNRDNDTLTAAQKRAREEYEEAARHANYGAAAH